HAAQVSVVAVDPVVGRVGLGDAPCADICHHLARHGVTAEAQIAVSGDRSEAEALLAWATGQDADLLVLGGYGHSRLRELVLGGVTRHVLENTAVPVLFSH
ncbi:MAG: universal stress protein, partial [Gammaproteobacteria bacterium]|nr:universal stress protein [Gammaproteobacteria bacterium]